MVGAVGGYTLQPMARTNHKFPGSSGRMFERKRNRQYIHMVVVVGDRVRNTIIDTIEDHTSQLTLSLLLF